MVDALPSGGSVRKDVLVRIQSRARDPDTSVGAFYLTVMQTCLQKQANKKTSTAIAGQGIWVRPTKMDH